MAQVSNGVASYRKREVSGPPGHAVDPNDGEHTYVKNDGERMTPRTWYHAANESRPGSGRTEGLPELGGPHFPAGQVRSQVIQAPGPR